MESAPARQDPTRAAAGDDMSAEAIATVGVGGALMAVLVPLRWHKASVWIAWKPVLSVSRTRCMAWRSAWRASRAP